MGKVKYKTFASEVWAEGDKIFKIYLPSSTYEFRPLARLKKEVFALRFYSKYYRDSTFTPSLISVSEKQLRIIEERIAGESLQIKAKKGQEVFKLAGEILRKIHLPVKRPKYYLKNKFENKVTKAFKSRHLNNLLNLEGIKKVDFKVDWDEVFHLGVVLLHKDYTLEHVIINRKNNRPYVIDWDYSDEDSPYEDFVIVQTSIINVFNHEDDFWAGYGFFPDQVTINEYIKLQCLRQLSFIKTLDQYLKEPNDGFYHRQTAILKKLI